MTVKDALEQFNKEKQKLTAILNTNKEKAHSWIRNEGHVLVNDFQKEIVKNNWQLRIISNDPMVFEVFLREHSPINPLKSSENNKIIITMKHEDQKEDRITITVSTPTHTLDSKKYSNIDLELLTDLLYNGLNEFYLKPLK